MILGVFLFMAVEVVALLTIPVIVVVALTR
jgi:hypothetical protein